MNIKDTYKFLLYGDSISKGIIYDEEKNRYTTLKESYASLLQDKVKGITYNAGKFGNTIGRAMSRLTNDVLKNKPDIVLIEFGGNDCDFDWEEVAKNPFTSHFPKTDFQDFENKLRELIESLQTNSITPVLMSLPPIDADKYFKWISKNDPAMANNILMWLGTVNKIYWWQERYNSAVINIAQETNTKWIDVRGAFLRHPDYTQFLCIDGIHPNVEGHKIIANKLFEYIKNNYSFLLKSKYITNETCAGNQ